LNKTFRFLILAALVLIAAAFVLAPPARGADFSEASRPNALTGRLERFLGLPFRVDGALDNQGRWVTFQHPDQVAGQAGFNCSGFTVAAARELFGRDIDLGQITRDRRGDSGPGAPLGQDWDFGLDLILNLAEGHPHRLLPEPEDLEAPPYIALSPRRSLGWGVSLHGPEFEEVLGRLQPGRLGFFVFSRPDGRFPAGVAYYHVGLIIPEGQALWLYHTTAGAKTHRLNLNDPQSLARLRRHFQPIKNGERRVFIVEVQL